MFDHIAIKPLTTPEDFPNLEFSRAALSEEAIALLGFQRTKQVSKQSRKAWMNGDVAPMMAEVRARGPEIFKGALQEIYREYIPLKGCLDTIGFEPTSIIDIGCGQALPDLFMHLDFGPCFTLIDIEQTTEQYHFFQKEGSGYASLQDAYDMLVDNGVHATKIKTINPRTTPEKMVGLTGDMLTSYYSCGFHYPVDEYADLMVQTLSTGGVVVLDLRKVYLRRKPSGLSRVLDAGETHVVYEDARSFRIMLRG